VVPDRVFFDSYRHRWVQGEAPVDVVAIKMMIT
jgi:hypothetical protein